MRRIVTLAVTALILGVTAPITVPFFGDVAEAEACSSDPDIQVDQDACSSTVAVSVTGNASGTNCQENLPAELDGRSGVSCITASGTGDAANQAGSNSCGYAEGSSLPDAPMGLHAPSASAGCVAVSGAGNASNSVEGRDSCGSTRTRWSGVPNVAVGCLAVSGAGNASNEANGFDYNCGRSTTFSLAAGCFAVSGTGDASNNVNHDPDASSKPRCGSAQVGAGIGCVAISGAGNASNSVDGACGHVPASGVAVGCVAISGAGSASNSAGSCSTTTNESKATVGCVEVGGGDI